MALGIRSFLEIFGEKDQGQEKSRLRKISWQSEQSKLLYVPLNSAYLLFSDLKVSDWDGASIPDIPWYVWGGPTGEGS